MGGARCLGASASAPALRPLDPLTFSAKVLVYGVDAAVDSNISKALSKQHVAEQQAMASVLARKHNPSSTDDPPRPPVAAEYVKPRDQFRHLDSPASRSLVNEIRPTPPEQRLQLLKKETLQANIIAGRTAYIPSIGATSVYVQLRRLEMERKASGLTFNRNAFLRPDSRPAQSLQQGLRHHGSRRPSTALAGDSAKKDVWTRMPTSSSSTGSTEGPHAAWAIF